MRLYAVPLALATGCTAVFGLATPVASDRDGGVVDQDSPIDANERNPPNIDASIDAGTDALVCSGEFVAIAGQSSRYYFNGANKPWASAEADCEDRGAHLVVIGNDVERTAVHNFNGTVVWMGLTDLVTTGTFLWVTDEDTGAYPPPTGAPWSTDPKSSTGCVALGGASGTFDILDCGNSRNYICECDGYAPDVANY